MEIVGWDRLRCAAAARKLPSRATAYYHNGAGGGGYGNPFERDPALVLEDVLDEKVSIEAARRDYGVAIDPVAMTVDVQETAKLRA
jgi:N-methylhydantoinase B/oxoprolinase/acetone carboxylase alpha subunit